MHNKSLLLTVKTIAVSAFVATAAFAMIPKPAVHNATLSESGESAASAALYRVHCSRCHGGDGRSNTKEGRRTEADDLTDESVQNMNAAKMARIIKNGKGEMPGSKLSSTKIAGIVRHVKSF